VYPLVGMRQYFCAEGAEVVALTGKIPDGRAKCHSQRC
jgi:hypothetical protein